MQLHFEWDAKKADINLRKHGISFSEAATVFKDPLAMTIFDTEHSDDEERWVTLGQVGGRKLVVVVHTWQDSDTQHIHVRIISARVATNPETQTYQG